MSEHLDLILEAWRWRLFGLQVILRVHPECPEQYRLHGNCETVNNVEGFITGIDDNLCNGVHTLLVQRGAQHGWFCPEEATPVKSEPALWAYNYKTDWEDYCAWNRQRDGTGIARLRRAWSPVLAMRI